MRRQAELLTGNLLLNTVLLDDAFKRGVRGYLYTSSSAVYPGYLEDLNEDAQWDEPPHISEANFGWAKRMGEIHACAYHEHHGFPIAIVRPANPYGPWDNFDPERSHVIPTLIRRAVARENPLAVWGTGQPVRSFVYASDVAELMLLALERLAICKPVNIASPDPVNIADLVKLVIAASGNVGVEFVFDTSVPDGHPRKIPSTRRAFEELGKKDYVRLQEGLVRTVDWYMENRL